MAISWLWWHWFGSFLQITQYIIQVELFTLEEIVCIRGECGVDATLTGDSDLAGAVGKGEDRIEVLTLCFCS